MVRCKMITQAGTRCSRDAVLLGVCLRHFDVVVARD